MGVENIDIDIITIQTGKNKILVRKTYFKNKKNTTDTIIELMNLKEEVIEKPLTEIEQFRKIMDEKDNIFHLKNSEKK